MRNGLDDIVSGSGEGAAEPLQGATDIRPAVAEPTMASLLGEIVWLLTQSPAHRHLFLVDLEWSVMPALMLRQVHLFRSKGRVVGVALWASVSDEVDARLSSGISRLAPLDWKSGSTLWLVDIIAPFGGIERILDELMISVFRDKTVKHWSVTNDGRREIKNINKKIDQ